MLVGWQSRALDEFKTFDKRRGRSFLCVVQLRNPDARLEARWSFFSDILPGVVPTQK